MIKKIFIVGFTSLFISAYCMEESGRYKSIQNLLRSYKQNHSRQDESNRQKSPRKTNPILYTANFINLNPDNDKLENIESEKRKDSLITSSSSPIEIPMPDLVEDTQDNIKSERNNANEVQNDADSQNNVNEPKAEIIISDSENVVDYAIMEDDSDDEYFLLQETTSNLISSTRIDESNTNPEFPIDERNATYHEENLENPRNLETASNEDFEQQGARPAQTQVNSENISDQNVANNNQKVIQEIVLDNEDTDEILNDQENSLSTTTKDLRKRTKKNSKSGCQTKRRKIVEHEEEQNFTYNKKNKKLSRSRAYTFTISNVKHIRELKEKLDKEGLPVGIRYCVFQIEKDKHNNYYTRGYVEADAAQRNAWFKDRICQNAIFTPKLLIQRDSLRARAKDKDLCIEGPWEYGHWLTSNKKTRTARGYRSDLGN